MLIETESHFAGPVPPAVKEKLFTTSHYLDR